MNGASSEAGRSAEEQRRWERYLYEVHSRAALTEWAPSLRYFRYCRAVGGHANDGDELVVALRFTTDEDLLALCDRIGIALPGRRRSGGRVTVAGVHCFVWIHDAHLTISVQDPAAHPALVTQQSVEGARQLEPLVEPHWWRVIEPPVDSDRCICPKHHLDIWVEHFA